MSAPLEQPAAPPPVVAVSMGDPGGIGPEVLVAALHARLKARSRGTPVRFRIFGSHTAMHAAATRLGLDPFWWRVERGSPLLDTAAGHDVVLVDFDAQTRAELGMAPDAELHFEHRPTKLGGELSFRFVEDAIAAARLEPGQPGHADAIVTAPISKAAWNLAGRGKYPGHTELLATRFRSKRYAMMFEGPRLRVVLATVHIPLMEIRNELTIGSVHDAIDLGAEGCQRLGVARPRIGVCGLNPHAGEDGLLGDEETRLIEPAVRLACDQGLNVRGPYPGDTIFNRAVAGEFDLVVAMYHDQGLIPVKLLDRDNSVNLTLGLPTVRTSPVHGTAFDLAGAREAKADPGSTAAAIECALRMVVGTSEIASANNGVRRVERA